MTNEKEAFEAFCAEWDRQANEYGASLSREQRDCAEEAWSAALAWAATQQAPVAWMHANAKPERKDARVDFSFYQTQHYTQPLYVHPAPAECAVPAGYVLVPAEPPIAMCEAALSEASFQFGHGITIDAAVHIYRAMLAAAPKLQGGA